MLSDTKKIRVNELLFDSDGTLTALGGFVYIFAVISFLNVLREVKKDEN